jgi:hypothetical protein
MPHGHTWITGKINKMENRKGQGVVIMDWAFGEKLRKETENFTRFGNWKIEKNGNLVYYENGFEHYVIGKDALTENNWIAHIKEKQFAIDSMHDFITAYFRALNNMGIKEMKMLIY